MLLLIKFSKSRITPAASAAKHTNPPPQVSLIYALQVVFERTCDTRQCDERQSIYARTTSAASAPAYPAGTLTLHNDQREASRESGRVARRAADCPGVSETSNWSRG